MAVVVFVPSRIGGGDFIDLPAPTAGDDAKAITYNHDTGAFVYAAAGGGTPGGSTTQVQYNNAGAFAGDAGMTYDAANDRLTVTGGLVAPSMRPASDSTTALQWQTAAGTAFVYGDTTNQRVGLGQASPVGRLHITTQSIADNIICDSNGTAFVAIPGIQMRINGTIQGYWATATAPNIYFTNGVVTGDMIFRSESASVVFGRGTTAALWVGQYVAVGQANSTALIDIAASSATRASLRIRSGVAPTTTSADGDMWNDGNAYAMRVNGTNAVNTDGGLSIWMQSSTTARNVGRVLWQYTDKTDATRVTKGALTAFYQGTERKAIHWSADASGPLLSFGAVTTPIATPVLATGAGATPDDIIAVLQSYGLVKQS